MATSPEVLKLGRVVNKNPLLYLVELRVDCVLGFDINREIDTIVINRNAVNNTSSQPAVGDHARLAA